jgi:predicted DNA-binding transcriptional regulator AlpA
MGDDEPLKFLNKRQVLDRLGVSNTQYYRGVRAGKYPLADVDQGTKAQRWTNKTILAAQKRLLSEASKR